MNKHSVLGQQGMNHKNINAHCNPHLPLYVDHIYIYVNISIDLHNICIYIYVYIHLRFGSDIDFNGSKTWYSVGSF